MVGFGPIRSASAHQRIDHSIIKSTAQNVEATASSGNSIPDNKSNSTIVSDVPDNFLDEGQAQLFLK
jgi:hypothetical protein